MINDDQLAQLDDPEWYLFEKYLPPSKRRPPRKLGLYYPLKKLIPRPLRHRAHGLLVRMRQQVKFPAWPYEPSLLALRVMWLERALERLGVDDALHIGFWPRPFDHCIVLTHDVDTPYGLTRMSAMAELEDKYGFRSSWNLPLEQFPIDWSKIEKLRSAGFEMGAHGLAHDGRLFRSAKDFQVLGARVTRLAREHDLRGFRAPSTLRRLEWLEALGFDYDCSFADTDPFEPQRGGCCSLFPYHIGAMVELPYTLPQDHTMMNLLHREPSRIWIEKAKWIASLGGMILTLVHPDYAGSHTGLREYEELLKRLNDMENAWRALPSQVAAWWKERSAMRLRADGKIVDARGREAPRGSLRRVRAEALVIASRNNFAAPAPSTVANGYGVVIEAARTALEPSAD